MFFVFTFVTSLSANFALFFPVSGAIPSSINEVLLSRSYTGIFSEWLSHIIIVTIIKPKIFNIIDYSLTFQKNNFK